MKIMVDSHDTYGLGNISRMLTICRYLLKEIPKLSILLVCSSLVVHSFRMQKRLNHIKILCIAMCAGIFTHSFFVHLFAYCTWS